MCVFARTQFRCVIIKEAAPGKGEITKSPPPTEAMWESFNVVVRQMDRRGRQNQRAGPRDWTFKLSGLFQI